MYTKLFNSQKHFFNTHQTKQYHFRKNQLLILKSNILKFEKEIANALYLDLGKSFEESYMTEIGMVIKEINYQIKNLEKNMKPIKKKSPITLFPAKSFLYPEPLGTVLIIAPWNYPFLLSIQPLVGALAAGNTAIIKPSEYSINTTKIIKQIINESFNDEYVSVVEGEVYETEQLLKNSFDYIFFTGSTNVGKIIMNHASKHLTPVTLELGGKSPAIIYNDANIDLAAKKIAFGKLINAGQTCIAPDYLMIQEGNLETFIKCFDKYVAKFYNEPLKNNNYPKIISNKHYLRLIKLMENENIIYGGQYNNQKISPTLIKVTNNNTLIMQEEIFGPILPIITFKTHQEVLTYLLQLEKPLATYVFTKNKKYQHNHLSKHSSGGLVINDTIIHFINDNLGFGGVGSSGMGKYHGEESFKTFTHYKAVVNKKEFFDLDVRYHPYNDKKVKIYKKVNR